MSVAIVRKVDGSLVEVLVLDATLSHSIRHSANVTENPIESGSEVNDHVQVKPVDLTVVGFVSNNPVTLLSFGVIPQQDETRAKTAYDALVQTFRNKELVQVQSELEIFDDMVIRSLDVPRDRTNAHALQFTAEFKKLTKAGTQVVEIRAEDQALAAPAEDLGKQTATESTDEEETQSSLLLQALQGVGVLN